MKLIATIEKTQRWRMFVEPSGEAGRWKDCGFGSREWTQGGQAQTWRSEFGERWDEKVPSKSALPRRFSGESCLSKNGSFPRLFQHFDGQRMTFQGPMSPEDPCWGKRLTTINHTYRAIYSIKSMLYLHSRLLWFYSNTIVSFATAAFCHPVKLSADTPPRPSHKAKPLLHHHKLQTWSESLQSDISRKIVNHKMISFCLYLLGSLSRL